MAEFVPIYKPGQTWTATASAAVTGGQALVVSGQDTVGPATGASAAFVGVAAFDAAAGDKVTVHSGGGVYELASAGAVGNGSPLATAAGGAVAALGDEGDPATVIGVALADAVSNKVKALLFR